MAIEWRVLVADPATEGGSVWAPDADPLRWDIGTWSGEIPSWTDVSQFVRRLRFKRGRRRLDQEMATGEAQVVVDNVAGLFNPSVGSTPARPGRWLRIEGRVPPGGWVPQWTGFIDSIIEGYRSGGADVVLELDCYDFLAQFNQTKRPELTSEVGAAERTDQRATRILDELFWGPSLRTINTGRHTMLGTTLAAPFLRELRVAAEAEGDGGVYIGPAGDVVFQNGGWRTAPDSATPQFSVGGAGDALQVSDPATDWALRRVVNDAIVYQRDNPTPARSQSTQSIGLYGTLAQERTLDVFLIGQAQTIADEVIARSEWDALRVVGFEAIPSTDAALADLLAADLLWRIALEVRTLAGWSYAEDVFINEKAVEVGYGDVTDTRWLFRVDQADITQPPP